MTVVLVLAALAAAPPPSASRQVAVLAEMVDAVNAGDAGRYARLYAPDAVITIPGNAPLQGRAAIEQYEVGLLREFPGARLGFASAWQKGPEVVVLYAVNGRTPDGRAMGHEGLLFYRFGSNGLVAEERRYLDGLTPMAQLGALGRGRARALPVVATGMTAHVAEGSRGEADNVALVRAVLSALEAKDEGAFLAHVADEGVWDELIEAQPRVGKRGVEAWFETWTAAVPDARSQITSLLGVGDHVLVEAIVRGTLKGPLGPLAGSDKPFAVHRGLVVRVEKGRLARVQAFMNGKELAQSVGQWPPTGAR